MSNLTAAQYWEYAEEAMLVASLSASEKEKEALIQLAQIWAQAALESESAVAGPPKATGGQPLPSTSCGLRSVMS